VSFYLDALLGDDERKRLGRLLRTAGDKTDPVTLADMIVGQREPQFLDEAPLAGAAAQFKHLDEETRHFILDFLKTQWDVTWDPASMATDAEVALSAEEEMASDDSQGSFPPCTSAAGLPRPVTAGHRDRSLRRALRWGRPGNSLPRAAGQRVFLPRCPLGIRHTIEKIRNR